MIDKNASLFASSQKNDHFLTMYLHICNILVLFFSIGLLRLVLHSADTQSKFISYRESSPGEVSGVNMYVLNDECVCPMMIGNTFTELITPPFHLVTSL